MRNFVILLFGLLISCQQSDETIESTKTRPEENRFIKEVFVSSLEEPTELDVLPDGRVLFVQRTGGIKLYDPDGDEMINFDSIPVYTEQEDGLMGLALDPGFSFNRWVYLYYSPIGDDPKQNLSRFRFTERGLTDEIIMLEVETQREECCHTGGSIQFGSDGLLYLSTGDDTNPFASSGYGPMDERAGRSAWDAQGTSSNTNDLRGKILRIKPETDGSYSIPEGNLFVDNNPLTRPEIYVMGCRNPYRIAVDGKRGWLFWGDVGPDAKEDDEKRGSRGYDEFNLAKSAGYFGWPLFVGPSLPYGDHDFSTGETGAFFDPKSPGNISPNNTGIKELPPANPALIYYPYAISEKFPQLGNGSRNAMAGPVYYSDEFQNAKTRFPDFFNGRVMYYDWMRGHIFFLSLTDEGEVNDWYRLMPNTVFNNPIDFEFGPDGSLYLLEYGTGWFSKNDNATLSRINYVRGNRPPILKVKSSSLSGEAPLTIMIDATGSFDYDNDRLRYEWKINGDRLKDSILNYTLDKEGIYYPELILRDVKGNKVRKQFKVTVGNAAPTVEVNITGNQSFFWKGRKLDYAVSVKDKEDGSLKSGINASEVSFDLQHFQSFDKAEVLGHQTPVVSGKKLIAALDCKSCHQPDATSIGPSYTKVANKYTKTEKNINYLIYKIINGGGGVWGEHVMAAHPELDQNDARKLVQYILSFRPEARQPLSGSMIVDKSEGTYFFSAQYSDQGKGNIPSITSKSEVLLRSNRVDAIDFDDTNTARINTGTGRASRIRGILNNTYVGFNNIDLTEIEEIECALSNNSGGEISVRIGGANGQEIGRLDLNTIRDQNKPRIKIDPVSEITDIYFMFLNPEADKELFSIQYFEFIPQK